MKKLICIFLVLSGCSSLNGSLSSPVVSIDSGLLRGVSVKEIYAFKGIPYAQAPIGDLRWRSTKTIEPWLGEYAADRYGADCAQIYNSSLWFELGDVSEDCLKLNVWSPSLSPRKKLPVMVWIHGGGFINGSGNIPRLNGSKLASQGVVLITVNYRLSTFGFMSHPAFSATNPDQANGNFAFYDLLESLRWVQRNIDQFGGDPDNVTIFGESAGAGMVNTLLAMPKAEGLFHRAISQSSAVGLSAEPFTSKKAGRLRPTNRNGLSFTKRLGIENNDPDPEVVVEAMRALSTETILSALTPRDRFTPVVDGQLLTDQVAVLFTQGKQIKVPYITGAVDWEASIARRIPERPQPELTTRIIPDQVKRNLYPGLSGSILADVLFRDMGALSASSYSAKIMSQQGVNVYRFYFSYVAEDRRGIQPGAAHQDEIAFIFGTLDNETDLNVISQKDQFVSDLMQSYWVQFARTGNPNALNLPVWPSVSLEQSPTLEIGNEVEVRDHLFDKRIAYHVDRNLDLLQRTRQ
ncbi:MAG: carboxylesterase family protein [Gammaproteobacteria bacterium]|nr:carboxylesterase family protein [Gammaproteobacteria bacterium]HJP04361.1 carboxylesterase family protein [Gammaproteobacteria bacterium]